MERPDTCQDGEPEKQERENPGLELRVEFKLRELLEIERVTSSCYVNGDDADEGERSAEERIERQLHRAVFLVGRTPDRDQEIFRDDDQLVEDKEEKEIGAQKPPVETADHEKQPEEELVRPLLDVPGKKDRAHRREAGDEAHGEADPVHGQVI